MRCMGVIPLACSILRLCMIILFTCFLAWDIHLCWFIYGATRSGMETDGFSRLRIFPPCPFLFCSSVPCRLVILIHRYLEPYCRWLPDVPVHSPVYPCTRVYLTMTSLGNKPQDKKSTINPMGSSKQQWVTTPRTLVIQCSPFTFSSFCCWRSRLKSGRYPCR